MREEKSWLKKKKEEDFNLGKPRSISGRSGEEKKTRISRMTKTRTKNLSKKFCQDLRREKKTENAIRKEDNTRKDTQTRTGKS